MTRLILHLNQWWNARVTSSTETHLQRELDAATEKIATITEELETERVRTRILKEEIDLLQKMNALNVERINHHVRQLGGLNVTDANAGPSDSG